MKTGVISGLAVLVGWALLAIVQLWWQPFTAELFFKLSVTAAIALGVILVITLAVREYLSEQRLKSKDYLDG